MSETASETVRETRPETVLETLPADERRAGAPVVVQPLGEGYREAEPAATGPLADDGLTDEAMRDQGVVPGHKAGNLLGLRDVSASAGGCGCGGHGGHGGHGEHGAHHHGEHGAHHHGEGGGCACGAH